MHLSDKYERKYWCWYERFQVECQNGVEVIAPTILF